MSRLRQALPSAASRPWVSCAGLAFGSSLLVSHHRAGVVLVAGPVLWLARRGRLVTALSITVVALSAWLSSDRLPPLPEGRLAGPGVMATDVIEGEYGPYAMTRLAQCPILADLPPGARAQRGDRVWVEGRADGVSGTAGGARHCGTVEVDTFRRLAGPVGPVLSLGNRIHDRVTQRLDPLRGGRALLAGFLVGHTEGVEDVDEAAMRRSGLSHFTAVSGSNVALFLTVLFIALGPIGVGPRRRAIVGLCALPVFAAATRFEPSVMRASVMAGLGLAGRLAGVGLEAWQILCATVLGLITIDPGLADNIGFQLSVAATGGVLIGARWPASSALRVLAVTVGAQVAVAPLLIAHFGSIPLLAPITNLLAAPLVALSTILGVVGMVGPVLFASAGAWLAGVVLWLAHSASGWPQVGWRGLLVCAVAAALFAFLPRARALLVLCSAGVVVALLVGQQTSLPEPAVVVLDVGQGDAILVAGEGGRHALVDGGPDPVRLLDGLRKYRVRQLELVVLTHAHADHAAGLSGLIGRIPIGLVWADLEPHETPASLDLIASLLDFGVPVIRPTPGEEMSLGAVTLTVVGPLRRYASPNDQSIVLVVEGPGRTMLLAGDTEAIAQADLGILPADVLKVPHHGAATSSLEWLSGVDPTLSVIPVGRNDFGHPSEEVVAALEASGSVVLRTDLHGDVVVELG